MRRLSAALLAGTLALAVAPPARAQGLERWLGDLSSPQPTTYRIAAAYVAHAGPAGLDSLAAWLPGATPTMRAHVKLALDVMLLTSIVPDELAHHPTLRALAATELAAADRHAAALCASREYEREIGALSDSTKAHHDALVALGGWAAPAAVQLTRCDSPTGRVFGARVLVELRAGAQAAALQALTRDSSIVIASEEEPQGRVTVGELARSYVAGFPFSNHLPGVGPPRTVSSEAEEFLNAVVRADGVGEPEWRIDNRLRDEAHTATARTWDEYWSRARAVLAPTWDAPPSH